MKLRSICLVDLIVEMSTLLFGVMDLIFRDGQSGAVKELDTIEAQRLLYGKR